MGRYLNQPKSEVDAMTPGTTRALLKIADEIREAEEELRLEHTKVIAKAAGRRLI